MNSGVSGSIRSGIRATFLGTIFTGIVQFAFLVILARILSPRDYGEYALCLSVCTLSTALVNGVIERSLVVHVSDDALRDKTSAIFLVAILTSVLSMAVVTCISIAGIIDISIKLLSLLLVASVIGSIAIIPRVAMRRDLQFGWIVVSEISSMFVGSGVVTVYLAISHWGSYSLAVGQVAQSIILVVILRLNCSLDDSWVKADLRDCMSLVRSAAGVWKTAAAEMINSQVAPLVLATRLGAVPLGLFNRTYSLVQMPIQLLTGSLSRVMVSALFAMRDDLPRFRENLMSLVSVAGVIIAPVAAGIAGSNETFILLAFGRNWLEAASFLPFIAISSWAVMMATLYGIALEAVRAFDVKTRNQIISTCCLIALSLAGTWIGLAGAAAGIALSGCILLLLTACAAAAELKISRMESLRWLLPGLVIAVPCFALSYLIGSMFKDLPVAICFALQIIVCALAQPMGLLAFYPKIAAKAVETVAPFLLRVRPLSWYLSARGVVVR